MFNSARRCVSNALTSLSISSGCNGRNINPIAGCYMRKLTRKANINGSSLKAVLTTGLLFIVVALYCLYGTSSNASVTVTPLVYSQQSLRNSDSVSFQPEAPFGIKVNEGNIHTNYEDSRSNNSKKVLKKSQTMKHPNSGSGLLTAADMYEPGFRIPNAGLCSPRTRLLVLITSAALPSHSQNRQAIRMTWMNRYGPSVTMAFLVGTPQMSETDTVAQILEAEEQALRSRLNQINLMNDEKLNEKSKLKSSVAAESGKTDAHVNYLNSNSGLYKFLHEGKQSIEEGLNAQAMLGLNKAEQVVQRVIGREHGRYGDIIQCQSRDTYTNLTLKSISALEWTRQYCPSARYLLKTDDDMFIDVHRLLRFIDKVETEAIMETSVSSIRSRESTREDQNEIFNADTFESAATSDLDVDFPPTIWGRLAHGWRPIRQHTSKYYVSRTQYSGRVFPDFCTGPAYLMTRSAIGPLYEGALGRDFDVVDDDDEKENTNNENVKDDKGCFGNKNMGKVCINGNQTSAVGGDKEAANIRGSGKNNVPYLKLEDVYLTGVVAERLSLRAAERFARQELKEKEKIALGGGDFNQKSAWAGKVVSDRGTPEGSKNTRLKSSDIIVKVRRINDDQFANKKITGRSLDRALCSGASPGDTVGASGNGGFSWFSWYWGDTSVGKDSKKKKKDQRVISVHMVKYFEQFDLWRRLMDGRTKCKS